MTQAYSRLQTETWLAAFYATNSPNESAWILLCCCRGIGDIISVGQATKLHSFLHAHKLFLILQHTHSLLFNLKNISNLGKGSGYVTSSAAALITLFWRASTKASWSTTRPEWQKKKKQPNSCFHIATQFSISIIFYGTVIRQTVRLVIFTRQKKQHRVVNQEEEAWVCTWELDSQEF